MQWMGSVQAENGKIESGDKFMGVDDLMCEVCTGGGRFFLEALLMENLPNQIFKLKF